MKTHTKKELLALLEEYPDDTKIVLSVDPRDLTESNSYCSGELYELGIPGDRSYDPEEKTVALLTWSQL